MAIVPTIGGRRRGCETFYISNGTTRGTYTAETMRKAVQQFVGVLLWKGLASPGDTISICVTFDRKLSWVPELGYLMSVEIPRIDNN